MRRLFAPAFIVALLSCSLFAYEKAWDFGTGASPPLAVRAIGNGSDVFLAVAQKQGGVSILKDNGKSATRLTSIGRLQLGNLDAMNLRIVGDRMYVVLGDFFGGKSKAGLAVFDISNPVQPKRLSIWASDRIYDGASDVAVFKGYAYLASMSRGVTVFEIGRQGSLREVRTILPDTSFPKKNPPKTQTPHARGLALDDERLYVAYDAGGLRILDLKDPANPSEIGRYANPALGAKPRAYNNVAISFPYAFVAVDYCGLEVLDVSRPKSILLTGWFNPWKCQLNSNNWFNSPGHTNQIEFDEARDEAFLSAGDSELVAVDVGQRNAPKEIPGYGKPKNGRGAWGVTKFGNNIYLTYIRSLIPFRSGANEIVKLAPPRSAQ
ncbi:MAG: hypothetical protein R2684_02875 [Pyrinomonadaceae bacterium]